MSNRKRTWILVAVFALLSSFPLFANLGKLHIFIWDEARVAASTCEMSKTGNLIVVTANYNPEMWSVKPPLALWCQSISVKLFGISEASVRLPSALAILLTGIIIILFAGKMQRPWIGFYASLVIISVNGITGFHVSRTADYDALLLLFTITYILCFYLYYHLKQNKYLLLFFIALSFACLTKGIQAMIPLPVLFAFAITQKQTFKMLKSKWLYIGLAIFLVLVGGYYFGRELLNEGYLQAVWKEEIGRQGNNVNDNENGYFWYYYDHLSYNTFATFFWLMPFVFVFDLFFAEKQSRKFSLYIFTIAIFYFIVISCAKTQCFWYAAPVIALCALLIGVCFASIHNALIKENRYKLLPYIATIAIFWSPLVNTYDAALYPKSFFNDRENGHGEYNDVSFTLQQLGKGKIDVDSITFWSHVEYQDFLFYRHMIEAQNIKINIKYEITDFESGEAIFVYKTDKLAQVTAIYDFDTIFERNDCKILRIKNKTAK